MDVRQKWKQQEQTRCEQWQDGEGRENGEDTEGGWRSQERTRGKEKIARFEHDDQGEDSQGYLKNPLAPDVSARAWIAPLLQTAPMQRLQTIRQLGFVGRIWPQAIHTRYEHSLDCYALARRALQHLVRLGAESPSTLAVHFTHEQMRAFLVAALLHDIGHAPFSHGLDGLGPLRPSHEQVGRRLIEHSEIAALLERDYQLAPTRVADLIDVPLVREHAEERNESSEARAEGDGLIRHLLNSPGDIDQLAYVARDANGCGMLCPTLDDPSTMLNHLVVVRPTSPLWRAEQLTEGTSGMWSSQGGQSVQIARTTAGTQPHLALTASALPLLRAWVHLRQWLYLHVYWHPVNRAANTMLTRAVYDALVAATLPEGELQSADDDTLLACLRKSGMPESTQALGDGVASEACDQLYQPVLSISCQIPHLFGPLHALARDAPRRTWVEQRLAASVGKQLHLPLASHDLLLDVVPPKSWSLDGWIWNPSPLMGMDACIPWTEALGVTSAELEHVARQHCHVVVLAAPRHDVLFRPDARTCLLQTLECIVAHLR